MFNWTYNRCWQKVHNLSSLNDCSMEWVCPFHFDYNGQRMRGNWNEIGKRWKQYKTKMHCFTVLNKDDRFHPWNFNVSETKCITQMKWNNNWAETEQGQNAVSQSSNCKTIVQRRWKYMLFIDTYCTCASVIINLYVIEHPKRINICLIRTS